jgi:predicted CopG family antitoxin
MLLDLVESYLRMCQNKSINYAIIKMKQKIAIEIDRDVYDALDRVIGQDNVSQFLENLARTHIQKEDLISAYRSMAADTDRESAALDWSNGLIAQP